MAKAKLTTLQTVALGVLTGVFIAFGAVSYTLVVTGSTLGFGPTPLLGGVAFALGLILVIIGAARALRRQQSAGDGVGRSQDHDA